MGILSKFLNSLRGATIYIGGAGTRTGPRNIDIERNEICSAIMDCNATHIAKAQVLHVVKDKDGRVSTVKRTSEYTRLFKRPNPMMTRQDFLYSMAWQLQLANLALAWVKWDGSHPVEIWPLVYLDMEVRERKDGGYAVAFTDFDGAKYIEPLENLIVLRRKYNSIGYTGQGNDPVKSSLEMVNALDEGMRQAVQISNKIHGLLKQKKSMLAGESVEKQQKDFIDRMGKAAKNGGVVALDAMEDYVPLNVSAWTANASQQKQITDRVKSSAAAAGRSLEDMVSSVNIVEASIDGLVSGLGNAAKQFTQAFKREKSSAASAAKSMADGATSAIKDSVTSGMGDVNSAWTSSLAAINATAKAQMSQVGSTMQSSINKLKQMFASTSFSFTRKIALPHFSMAGSFNAQARTVPRVSVTWYRKAYDDAYLLNGATIFGAMGGRYLGGGDGPGSEMVVGTDKLMSMIQAASGGNEVLPVLNKILAAVNNGSKIVLDSGALVGSTCGKYDNAMGQKRALTRRGAI